MDYNKTEFEFLLNTSCRILEDFDYLTNKSKTIIELVNPQNLIAYQTWSSDTLLINNKSRRSFPVSPQYFFTAVEQFNNNPLHKGETYKPSIIIRNKNTHEVHMSIVEKFHVVHAGETSSSDDDCNCLNFDNLGIGYRLVCDNNFTDLSYDTSGERIEKLPVTSGNIEVTINFSPIPYSDLDFHESRDYHPFGSGSNEQFFFGKARDKTTNCWEHQKDNLFDSLKHKHISRGREMNQKRDFNFIVDDTCSIEFRKGSKCIVIKDPKLIKSYQVWNKGSKTTCNNRRVTTYISAAQLAASAQYLNQYLQYKKQKDMFPFTPSAYIEYKGSQYFVVIKKIEMSNVEYNKKRHKSFNSDVPQELVLYLDSYKMQDFMGNYLATPPISSTKEPIYINIDPINDTTQINIPEIMQILIRTGYLATSQLALRGLLDIHLLFGVSPTFVKSLNKSRSAKNPRKVNRSVKTPSFTDSSPLNKFLTVLGDTNQGKVMKSSTINTRLRNAIGDTTINTLDEIVDENGLIGNYNATDGNFYIENPDILNTITYDQIQFRFAVGGKNNKEDLSNSADNPTIFWVKSSGGDEFLPQPRLKLYEGFTYIFDYSDESFRKASEAGFDYTLLFSMKCDGTNNPESVPSDAFNSRSDGIYRSPVRAGFPGAQVQYTPPQGAVNTLYYYDPSSNANTDTHVNMGNSITTLPFITITNNIPTNPETPPEGGDDFALDIGLAIFGVILGLGIGYYTYRRVTSDNQDLDLEGIRDDVQMFENPIYDPGFNLRIAQNATYNVSSEGPVYVVPTQNGGPPELVYSDGTPVEGAYGAPTPIITQEGPVYVVPSEDGGVDYMASPDGTLVPVEGAYGIAPAATKGGDQVRSLFDPSEGATHLVTTNGLPPDVPPKTRRGTTINDPAENSRFTDSDAVTQAIAKAFKGFVEGGLTATGRDTLIKDLISRVESIGQPQNGEFNQERAEENRRVFQALLERNASELASGVRDAVNSETAVQRATRQLNEALSKLTPGEEFTVGEVFTGRLGVNTAMTPTMTPRPDGKIELTRPVSVIDSNSGYESVAAPESVAATYSVLEPPAAGAAARRAGILKNVNEVAKAQQQAQATADGRGDLKPAEYKYNTLAPYEDPSRVKYRQADAQESYEGLYATPTPGTEGGGIAIPTQGATPAYDNVTGLYSAQSGESVPAGQAGARPAYGAGNGAPGYYRSDRALNADAWKEQLQRDQLSTINMISANNRKLEQLRIDASNSPTQEKTTEIKELEDLAATLNSKLAEIEANITKLNEAAYPSKPETDLANGETVKDFRPWKDAATRFYLRAEQEGRPIPENPYELPEGEVPPEEIRVFDQVLMDILTNRAVIREVTGPSSTSTNKPLKEDGSLDLKQNPKFDRMLEQTLDVIKLQTKGDYTEAFNELIQTMQSQGWTGNLEIDLYGVLEPALKKVNENIRNGNSSENLISDEMILTILYAYQVRYTIDSFLVEESEKTDLIDASLEDTDVELMERLAGIEVNGVKLFKIQRASDGKPERLELQNVPMGDFSIPPGQKLSPSTEEGEPILEITIADINAIIKPAMEASFNVNSTEALADMITGSQFGIPKPYEFLRKYSSGESIDSYNRDMTKYKNGEIPQRPKPVDYMNPRAKTKFEKAMNEYTAREAVFGNNLTPESLTAKIVETQQKEFAEAVQLGLNGLISSRYDVTSNNDKDDFFKNFNGLQSFMGPAINSSNGILRNNIELKSAIETFAINLSNGAKKILEKEFAVENGELAALLNRAGMSNEEATDLINNAFKLAFETTSLGFTTNEKGEKIPVTRKTRDGVVVEVPGRLTAVELENAYKEEFAKRVGEAVKEKLSEIGENTVEEDVIGKIIDLIVAIEVESIAEEEKEIEEEEERTEGIL